MSPTSPRIAAALLAGFAFAAVAVTSGAQTFEGRVHGDLHDPDRGVMPVRAILPQGTILSLTEEETPCPVCFPFDGSPSSFSPRSC